MVLKVFPYGKFIDLMRFTLILLIVLLIPSSNLFPTIETLNIPEPLKTTGSQNFPLAFIPTLGSQNANTLFQVPFMGGNVAFSTQGLTFSFHTSDQTLMNKSTAQENTVKPLEDIAEYAAVASNDLSKTLRLNFIGANPETQLEGLQTGTARINYLIGQDQGKWRTGLASYESIQYSQLYPGIDLRYDGLSGSLKGTYQVEPGADPALIRWHYEGGQGMQLNAKTGVLQLRVSADQSLMEHAPIAWQTIEGKRQYVEARYQLHSDHSVGFKLGRYDRAYPLIIDPTLSYSSYLGGSGLDHAYAIGLDRYGNIYISGETTSADFPAGLVESPEVNGYGDAIVIKLTPDGKTILFVTFIGGSDRDLIWYMAVDEEGYAAVLGRTDSQDFPTVNPVQAEHGGGVEDVFVSRLSPDGSTLLYSTYLGGNDDERRYGIVLDSEGSAYITGWTESADFPVLNALQTQFGGGEKDAFVAKLSSTGELVYSTFLGGSETDAGYAIALDSNRNVYVSGYTTSVDFPLKSPLQTDYKGGAGDLFITKLGPDGQEIRFSTYLGGGGYDNSYDMLVDNQDRLLITGKTDSDDFPVVNPIQEVHGGGSDVFVVKMPLDGSALDFSLYLGGDNLDKGYGIAVDAEDNIFVIGWVESLNFPIVDPVQGACAEIDCEDTLLFKLKADGSALIYSTYLGGTGEDYHGRDVAVDEAGNALIVGFTDSTDFPTVDPIQDKSGGKMDMYLARIITEGGAQPPIWKLFVPQMEK